MDILEFQKRQKEANKNVVIMNAWNELRVWSPLSFPILNQSILYRKVRKVSM
jgi:hypothetical protein